jgi:hypothetical protein
MIEGRPGEWRGPGAPCLCRFPPGSGGAEAGARRRHGRAAAVPWPERPGSPDSPRAPLPGASRRLFYAGATGRGPVRRRRWPIASRTEPSQTRAGRRRGRESQRGAGRPVRPSAKTSLACNIRPSAVSARANASASSARRNSPSAQASPLRNWRMGDLPCRRLRSRSATDAPVQGNRDASDPSYVATAT